jgi:hypothetical protein
LWQKEGALRVIDSLTKERSRCHHLDAPTYPSPDPPSIFHLLLYLQNQLPAAKMPVAAASPDRTRPLDDDKVTGVSIPLFEAGRRPTFLARPAGKLVHPS